MCCFYTPVQWVASCLQWAAGEKYMPPPPQANTKGRERGAYYERMWRRALAAGGATGAVSITSYNEWGEGTQIEPAAPRAIPLPPPSAAGNDGAAADADDDDRGGGVVSRAVRRQLCRPARATFCARDAYQDYSETQPTGGGDSGGGEMHYLEATRGFSEELRVLLGGPPILPPEEEEGKKAASSSASRGGGGAEAEL